MLETTDLYYRRREAQERKLAGQSGNIDVRRIHERLAEEYAGRATGRSGRSIGDRI